MLNKGLVFGIGPGRNGSLFLASILNSQNGIVCFHEANAYAASWYDGEVALRSLIQDLEYSLHHEEKSMSAKLDTRHNITALEKLKHEKNISLIGDVASYHLPYIEWLIELHPNTKVIAVTRKREEVIRSFTKKIESGRRMRFASTIGLIPRKRGANHWQYHDGTAYNFNPVWDKCFPKFDAMLSREEAIGAYWDYYIKELGRLSERHPENVIVVDISELSTRSGQEKVLGFIGIGYEMKFVFERFNAS